MFKELLEIFTQDTARDKTRDKTRERSPQPRKPPNANPYRAVAIVPGTHCCEAAKLKRHTKILMRGAPALPLGHCSMPQRCTCHYARYEDRRESPRRAFGQDTQNVWYAGQERRLKRGRRAKD